MALGIRFARSLIRKGGEKRLGFRRMTDLLGRLDLRYEWARMRLDYRKGLQSAGAIERLIFLGKHRRPTLLTLSPPLKRMLTSFRYGVRTTWYNPEKRMIEERITNINSDRLRVRGTVEEEGRLRFKDIIKQYNLDLIKYELVRVESRALE